MFCLGGLPMRLPMRSVLIARAGILIAGYVLVWWLYAVIAKSSQDIHFDMGEVVSWSLIPAFGYAKHPPFPAWVASAWFSIFPYTDWAYYLLATASYRGCAMVRLADRGALRRRSQARARADVPDIFSRLQPSAAQVQLQCIAYSGLGGSLLSIPARVHAAQPGGGEGVGCSCGGWGGGIGVGGGGVWGWGGRFVLR